MQIMNVFRGAAITTALVLITATAAMAQYDRIVLIEDFSSVTCTNCPRASEIVTAIEQENKTRSVTIQYHLDIPGLRDPFYAANKPHNDARANYYGGFNGLPQVFVNGIASEATNEPAVRADFASGLSEDAPLSLNVSQTNQGGNFNISIVVETQGALPNGYRIYAVAVEGVVERSAQYFRDTAKSVPYIGETVFHDLFRTFVSPVGGEELIVNGAGQTPFNWSYQLGDRWKGEEMYVIAWVQDEFTNDIIQAGFSPKPPSLSVNEIRPMAGYSLEAVAPNPSMGDARMNFTLGAPEVVELAMYNTEGQLIRTVRHGRMESGAHTVEVDVEGLPAGVYTLSLRAGQYQATEKLTVVH